MTASIEWLDASVVSSVRPQGFVEQASSFGQLEAAWRQGSSELLVWLAGWGARTCDERRFALATAAQAVTHVLGPVPVDELETGTRLGERALHEIVAVLGRTGVPQAEAATHYQAAAAVLRSFHAVAPELLSAHNLIDVVAKSESRARGDFKAQMKPALGEKRVERIVPIAENVGLKARLHFADSLFRGIACAQQCAAAYVSLLGGPRLVVDVTPRVRERHRIGAGGRVVPSLE